MQSFVTINFTRFKDNTAYLGEATYMTESVSVNIRYSNFYTKQSQSRRCNLWNPECTI